jgi:hypothetical protein
VLLDFGREGADAAAALQRFVQTATSARVPLRVISLDDASVRRTFETRWVLVRPDGHVAWRGDALPVDGISLVAHIAGRT